MRISDEHAKLYRRILIQLNIESFGVNKEEAFTRYETWDMNDGKKLTRSRVSRVLFVRLQCLFLCVIFLLRILLFATNSSFFHHHIKISTAVGVMTKQCIQQNFINFHRENETATRITGDLVNCMGNVTALKSNEHDDESFNRHRLHQHDLLDIALIRKDYVVSDEQTGALPCFRAARKGCSLGVIYAFLRDDPQPIINVLGHESLLCPNDDTTFPRLFRQWSASLQESLNLNLNFGEEQLIEKKTQYPKS